MTLYFAKLCYAVPRPSSNAVKTWVDFPNPDRPDGKWPGNGREEARQAIRQHLVPYARRDECEVLLIPEHRHHALPLAPEHIKHPAISR